MSPSEFPDVPIEFREQLQKAKCLIPQSGPEEKQRSENVISGSFADKDQIDWAVVCYTRRVRWESFIWIFWGKPSGCPSKLAMIDRDAEGMDKPELRDIRAVKPGISTRSVLTSRGVPTVDHLAIEDDQGAGMFLRYCSAGMWYDVKSLKE